MKHATVGLVGALFLMACVAHAETIRVDKSKQVAAYSCADEDVVITGNDNTLTISGSCRNVSVTGNNNHLVLAQAQTISLPGHDNVVTWKTGSPKLTNGGGNNHAAMEDRDTPHPTSSSANTDSSQQTYGSQKPAAPAPPPANDR